MSPQERIKILQEVPKDSWVVFSEDESKFLGYGSTYEEAVMKAEKQGESEPVVVKTPENWIERILSS